jgi:arylsulfatase A-like enzyme
LRLPGFEQGFHEYHWPEAEYGKVEDSFPDATSWLNQTTIRPFFLFIHTYESHRPYTRDTFCKDLPSGRLGNLSAGEPLLPKGITSCTELTRQESLYVEAAYDGGVKKACDATAALLLHLESLGLTEKTVVIVWSDHGEEFWDHSNVFAEHSSVSLYGELLNVPFLVYAPQSQKRTVQIVDEETSTIDLLPTVADLLDIRLQDRCDGVSLRPLILGRSNERDIPILAMDLPEGETRPTKTCVILQGVKYTEPLEPQAEIPEKRRAKCGYYPAKRELFRLMDDPSEKFDLAGEAMELTREMAALLREGLNSAARPKADSLIENTPSTLPYDLRKQLRALGYLDME